MKGLLLLILCFFSSVCWAQIDCRPGDLALSSSLPQGAGSTSDRLLACRQQAGTNALYYSPDINNAELIGFLEANRGNSELDTTIQNLRNQSAQEYTRYLQGRVIAGEMTSQFYSDDMSKRTAFTEFTTLYNRSGGGQIPQRPSNVEIEPEGEGEASDVTEAESETETEVGGAGDETVKTSPDGDPTEPEEQPALETPEAIFDALVAAGPINTGRLNQARTACTTGDEQEVQLQTFKGSWAEGTGSASILPISFEPIVEAGSNRIGMLRYYKDAVIIDGQVISDAGIKERKVSLINGIFTVETPPENGASRSWQIEFTRSTAEEVAKLNPTEGEQIQSASCYLAGKLPATSPAPPSPSAPSTPPASEVTQ